MSWKTTGRSWVNGLLKRGNLKLETLTATRQETERLLALDRTGYFDAPVFPIPPSFPESDYPPIIDALTQYRPQLERLTSAATNDVRFELENGYYDSPDAEVLYAQIRRLQPKRVVEVGCGNSTRLIRQAILDGQLGTEMVAIDPDPRQEIASLVDQFFQQRVEEMEPVRIANLLGPGDLLFIDSSHQLTTGNDVSFLYLQVLPLLARGVLVHIHDIFLPFDYPRSWIVEERWNWSEQYLVQMMLQGDGWGAQWPGRYLQLTQAGFGEWFPLWKGATARSLWLKKRSEQVR